MSEGILAALIGFAGAVVAALIGVWASNHSANHSKTKIVQKAKTKGNVTQTGVVNYCTKEGQSCQSKQTK